MIFLPVRPVSPYRTADNEAAGRVDQITGSGGEHVRGQDRLDNFLDHPFGHVVMADAGIMLG